MYGAKDVWGQCGEAKTNKMAYGSTLKRFGFYAGYRNHWSSMYLKTGSDGTVEGGMEGYRG